MENSPSNFHHFALRSILFKGHADWYISYLKSERIGQVLTVLSENMSDNVMTDATRVAAHLPEAIVYFAAGERDLPFLLAEVFALITGIKLSATAELLDKDNALVIIAELETIAQRLGGGPHPSPFITTDDFRVPLDELPEGKASVHERVSMLSQKDIEDTVVKGLTKGQSKGHQGQVRAPSNEQKERTAKILEVVTKNNGVSVRDIAKEVLGCSEKTIQRELALLIEQGLVKKSGERRWSVYFAA